MPLTLDEVQYACGPSGSLEKTEAMIKQHGADRVAAWRDRYGCTALYYAVNNDDSDVLSALIRAGVDVTVTVAGNGVTTVLHWAKTAEAVCVLTAATANMALVSARTPYGSTPLHYACIFCHVEAARAMLEVSGGIPRFVLAKDSYGKTARDIASSLGHTELLSILGKAMEEAELWSRRSAALLIGLAAADVVKAVAVAAGKKWAL